MFNLKQYEDKKYTKIAVYTIITAIIIFVLCVILSLSGGFFSKLFLGHARFKKQALNTPTG